MNEFLEYINIHRISLTQDLDKFDRVNEYHHYLLKAAEIELCNHFLSVGRDILEAHQLLGDPND
jgi:hypothetical protein